MGRGLGKLLAQKGANVVIVARNKEKLAEALTYISVGNITLPRPVLPGPCRFLQLSIENDRARQKIHRLNASTRFQQT